MSSKSAGRLASSTQGEGYGRIESKHYLIFDVQRPIFESLDRCGQNGQPDSAIDDDFTAYSAISHGSKCLRSSANSSAL